MMAQLCSITARACALPDHLHSAVGHCVTVTKLAVFGVSVKRMYDGQHGQDPGQAKRTRFPDKMVSGQFDGQRTPNWTGLPETHLQCTTGRLMALPGTLAQRAVTTGRNSDTMKGLFVLFRTLS